MYQPYAYIRMYTLAGEHGEDGGCPEMAGATMIDGDGAAACASERRCTGVAGRGAGRARGRGAYGRRRTRAGGERGQERARAGAAGARAGVAGRWQRRAGQGERECE
jgi:hypothetical protein